MVRSKGAPLSGTLHQLSGIHLGVKTPETPTLVDLVRSALERVEKAEQSEEQKAAVDKLRSSVVRSIAEHELRTSSLATGESTPEDTAA